MILQNLQRGNHLVIAPFVEFLQPDLDVIHMDFPHRRNIPYSFFTMSAPASRIERRLSCSPAQASTRTGAPSMRERSRTAPVSALVTIAA